MGAMRSGAANSHTCEWYRLCSYPQEVRQHRSAAVRASHEGRDTAAPVLYTAGLILAVASQM